MACGDIDQQQIAYDDCSGKKAENHFMYTYMDQINAHQTTNKIKRLPHNATIDSLQFAQVE